MVAIADKYFVNLLLKFIAAQHEAAVSSNAWSVLTFAVVFGRKDLRDKCAQRIAADTRQQMDSEEFKFASADAIAAVIALDFKYDEEDVYGKCMMWAKQQFVSQELEVTRMKMRSFMEPFIHMIAFPGMKLPKSEGPRSRSGVLSPSEACLIIKSFEDKKVETKFRKEARKGYPCLHWKANKT